jgi:hypothetical protein
MAQPQLSTEYLRRTLGYFLETAQAGSFDDVLLGDRLLVITETTFSEIPSQLSGPSLLSFEISLGFGCPDECTVTVEEFLRRLSEASSQGRVLTSASPEIAALANWPSLSFRASDTTWRVSFSASGSQVVAVEVLR